MIRLALTSFASLLAVVLPADDPEAELHPALERAKTAFEALLQPDGDRAACLEAFSASARRSTGDERILSFLEMFQRDVPGARAASVRETEGGQGELILYSRAADAAAILTLSLEDDPPHGFGLVSAQLADGNPVVAGLTDGMSTADMVALLEPWLAELAAADRFSGAVLLAKDGEVVFEGAYGLASRRYEVPNRVDTKFNLGSMNKMFTAVAIAQLVERKKLAYDDHVVDVLRDYPRPDLLEGITIHHLLTHTSGLGNFWEAMFETDWTKLRTPADHVPLFADQEPDFEPGARFAYSNTGFLVLGLVVEEVSGRSYYDYVRDEIFAPAGMNDTDSYAADDPVPNLAIGHTRGDGEHHGSDGPLRENLFLHRVRGGPAGGGYSTVGDLLRFGQALLSGELLPPAVVERLITGKVATGWGAGERYAYGFIDRESYGNRFVGHNGGAPGINAELALMPADGWTIAVLANMDGAATRVAARLREMVGRADD